jgi:putative phosphonate metabolism protein
VTGIAGWRRYAVYWAPEAGSPLWRFGSAWLGWDAEAGEAVPHPPLPEAVAPPAPLPEITATPRRYGFHATLKPPFTLAEDAGPEALLAEAEALAARTAPFAAPPLDLVARGRFAALRLSAPSAAMTALAADAVRALDAFRAPPPPEELERRRAADLDPAEEDNLRRWGYPWVMDRFDFHLTLTGPMEAEALARTAAVLDPLTAPFRRDPLAVREIALYGDPGAGRPFRLLRRLPLTGEGGAP